MLRDKYPLHIIIIILFLFQVCCLRNTVAHEGHDHSHEKEPVTIGRSTYTHFKSILLIYQEVYDNLIKRELNRIPALVQKLLDAADKGIQTESKGPGRNMMEHIHKGTQRLKQAEGLQEVQEAFASISEAVIPFFKSWPNQLRKNGIKLYLCKVNKLYWLQPQKSQPICPYSSDEFF